MFYYCLVKEITISVDSEVYTATSKLRFPKAGFTVSYKEYEFLQLSFSSSWEYAAHSRALHRRWPVLCVMSPYIDTVPSCYIKNSPRYGCESVL